MTIFHKMNRRKRKKGMDMRDEGYSFLRSITRARARKGRQRREITIFPFLVLPNLFPA